MFDLRKYFKRTDTIQDWELVVADDQLMEVAEWPDTAAKNIEQMNWHDWLQTTCTESGLNYKFRCPRRLVDVIDGRCSSLEWASILKPHLNYEILHVNWRDYENSGT